MTYYLIIFVAFFVEIIFSQSLNAQTVNGKLYDFKDSSIVVFAQVVSLDDSDSCILGVPTTSNGEFIINLPIKTNQIKIIALGYCEVNIINIDSSKIIGTNYNFIPIPLMEVPEFIDVQFVGISKKKEQRCQKKITDNYNKKVNNSQDIVARTPYGNFTMFKKSEIECGQRRLKLVYYINFNEIAIREE